MSDVRINEKKADAMWFRLWSTYSEVLQGDTSNAEKAAKKEFDNGIHRE